MERGEASEADSGASWVALPGEAGGGSALSRALGAEEEWFSEKELRNVRRATWSDWKGPSAP